jgi:(p)ppGpp synthase/HD superfamily hydrolase
MLGRAIEIASVAFSRVQDKSGKPYILHCLWVMDKVRHLGEKAMIVAILHDLVEDTDWTLQMLLDEGFDQDIVIAIGVLTHDDDDSYEVYVQKISLNKLATPIKLRDLEHNSKITRLKGIRDKDILRIQKYNKAYMFLKEVKQ